ncbi:MAG: DUF3135 domain-containing protein [Chromatiales bacterium]|jgi:hypothetical protein
MKDRDFSSLDFDAMTAIAKEDPVEFERLRQMAIDEFIESVPPERRGRLRSLQWRIDQERRNRTPLSACLRISKMMWEHLLGPNGLLGLLSEEPVVAPIPAKIIPIAINRTRRSHQNLPQN